MLPPPKVTYGNPGKFIPAPPHDVLLDGWPISGGCGGGSISPTPLRRVPGRCDHCSGDVRACGCRRAHRALQKKRKAKRRERRRSR